MPIETRSTHPARYLPTILLGVFLGLSFVTAGAAPAEDVATARLELLLVDGGAPLADTRATVELNSVSSRSSSSTWATDEAGFFEGLGDLEPGLYELRVTVAGYRQVVIDDLDLQPGARRLELSLQRGASLDGLVVDADGRGVENAWVKVVCPVEDEVYDARTDAEGRFEIAGLPAGRHVVRVQHGDHAPARQEVTVDETASVEVRLGRALRISGRVIDTEGRGIEGARVRFASTDSGPEALSGPDGTFVLEPSTPGWRALRISKDGFGEHFLHELLQPQDADVDGVEVVLTRGVVVRGRIRGLDPGELADVRLSGQGPTGYQKGRVNHDGTFEISYLAPGEWRLKATQGAEGRGLGLVRAGRRRHLPPAQRAGRRLPTPAPG